MSDNTTMGQLGETQGSAVHAGGSAGSGGTSSRTWPGPATSQIKQAATAAASKFNRWWERLPVRQLSWEQRQRARRERRSTRQRQLTRKSQQQQQQQRSLPAPPVTAVPLDEGLVEEGGPSVDGFVDMAHAASNETGGESANNEDDEDGSGSGDGGGGVGGGNHDNDDGGCRTEDNEEVPVRDDERIPYKYELSNENRILQFEESTGWAEGGSGGRAETERPEMLAAQGDVEQEERAR